MSFLDNLENSLKSLEDRDEAAGQDQRKRQQQEAERARAIAAAPHAEKLKSSKFTANLLSHATRMGFKARTKVNISWIGTTLRLDARGERMELRPGPDGISAVFLQDGTELSSVPVDLDSDPELLAGEWVQRWPH